MITTSASPNLIVTIVLIAMTVALPEASRLVADEKEKPNRYLDLLEEGTPIMLKTSSKDASCSIRILSDEQAAAVEEAYEQQVEAQRQSELIGRRIEMERRLEQLASLLKEQQEVAQKASRIHSQMYARAGNYYRVTNVGEDYIAVKRGDETTYIPSHRIHEMTYNEKWTPTISSTGASSRVSTRNTRYAVRLRNVDATELSAVLEKLYPDAGIDIAVDDRTNSIIISGDYAQTHSMRQLVQLLEQKVTPGNQ